MVGKDSGAIIQPLRYRAQVRGNQACFSSEVFPVPGTLNLTSLFDASIYIKIPPPLLIYWPIPISPAYYELQQAKSEFLPTTNISRTPLSEIFDLK
jgi:hypothetical protein